MQDLSTAVMQWGQEGFCCSQVMILAGLALTGKENKDLTAAMNGLCRGTFSPACTCGALTGACCLLGFYAGKGAPFEEKDPKLPEMIGRLHEWFQESWGSGGRVNCGDILGHEPITDPKKCFQKCFPMIMETLDKALELLETHGFDIREGRPL